MTNLKTTNSIAAFTDLYLYNDDDVAFTLGFETSSDGIVYTNQDITNYAFSCRLMHYNKLLATYSIGAGATTSAFLSKSANVLLLAAMFADIRTLTQGLYMCKLIVGVTDATGQTFDYLIINVYVTKH